MAHHSTAPMSVTLAVPPSSPSQVRLGLMAGTITCLLGICDQAYCRASLSCTMSTKKNSSRTVPPASVESASADFPAGSASAVLADRPASVEAGAASSPASFSSDAAASALAGRVNGSVNSAGA